MRFLMLVCGVEPREDVGVDPTTDWVAEMDRRRVRVLGDRLRPISAATTVRVEDGGPLVSDGPFAETKEHILGFDVLECADLDEAVAVAAKHPGARSGRIELRPVWPFE
jgi:hypothetical protein